jgi:hypothetical protein
MTEQKVHKTWNGKLIIRGTNHMYEGTKMYFVEKKLTAWKKNKLSLSGTNFKLREQKITHERNKPLSESLY